MFNEVICKFGDPCPMKFFNEYTGQYICSFTDLKDCKKWVKANKLIKGDESGEQKSIY